MGVDREGSADFREDEYMIGDDDIRPVDVAVIGGGQAGLAAAGQLRRRGLRPLGAPDVEDGSRPAGRFVVLDANARPGGAWQHRWPGLTMATVNNITDLPGMPLGASSPDAESRVEVPAYFAAYEQAMGLRVRRPVSVTSVARGTGDRLLVHSDRGAWAARFVINATGTWTQPIRPVYPGQETFAGRVLHAVDYRGPDEFAGRRVVVVGAGVTAVQFLGELARVADTFWVSRRPPDWRDGDFTSHLRAAAVHRVERRVEAGLPPLSVVAATGLCRGTGATREAEDAGALVNHPMFASIEPGGVRMPDGSFERADAILYATGFRWELAHLRALGLRTAAGGVRMDGVRSVDEPRLFLVGYGPSSSTVGASQAGYRAALLIARELGAAIPPR
jgi:thioredoxin reductase